MIAKIALFAICLPKLAETLFAPNACAATVRSSDCCKAVVCDSVSVLVRTWKLW